MAGYYGAKNPLSPISTGSKVWVLRLDANGSVKWQKTYGGGMAHAVAIAKNDDILVAGWTRSFGAGKDDVFVARLSPDGQVKWFKTYGGSGDDLAYAVALAPNGDIIVAGYTDSFGAGKDDAWVLCLDGNGNVKWQKTYGGKKDDGALAVALDGSDIIVAGVTWSFSLGAISWPSAWILKLDSNGNVKWQKTYGGGRIYETFAVVLVPNRDIIVVGDTFTGTFDAWVLRLDANGNIKWQKTYGGKKSDDYAYAVAIAPNGDVIVAGRTDSFGAGGRDAWVLRLPPNGELPGCDFCGNSNARVTSTNAQVLNSNAKVFSTHVTSESSNAVVKAWTPRVKTQYPAGQLSVSSTPSGAKVYVNGSYEGVTPLTLNLSPGTYNVTLVKAGYENYSTVVSLMAGAKKSISTTFQPLPFSTSSSSSTTSIQTGTQTSGAPSKVTQTKTSTGYVSSSEVSPRSKTTKGGICGPALLILLTLTPLLLKRKKRRKCNQLKLQQPL